MSKAIRNLVQGATKWLAAEPSVTQGTPHRRDARPSQHGAKSHRSPRATRVSRGVAHSTRRTPVA